MKTFVLAIINGYKEYISPFLPHSCRFHPTCSQYCREAVELFGLLKGLGLFARRVLKCHPFHPGGYDPVDRPENSAMQGGCSNG